MVYICRFGGYSKFAELLSLLAQGFSNQQQIVQLETFYNTKLTEFGSSATAVRTAIDEAKLDLQWADEHLPDAFNYMNEMAGTASIVCTSFSLLFAAILVIFW